MARLFTLLASFALAAVLFVPGAVKAATLTPFTSFGGKVVTAIPCISPLGPSLHVTIVPAPFSPVPIIIWTPLTITKLFGPPIKPDQEVLGVADIPYTCAKPVPFPPYLIPLPPGLRMTMVGTSAPAPKVPASSVGDGAFMSGHGLY